MRQGPYYDQWVDRDEKGNIFLRLPLELVEEWSEMKTVMWEEVGDGSYILRPS